MNARFVNRKTIYSGPNSYIQRAEDAAQDTAQRPCSLVALKIVDVDFNMAPHSIEREIAILRKVQSTSASKYRPRVLQYIADYQHHDDRVLVSEYYAGGDLQQLMQPGGRYVTKRTRYNLDEPDVISYQYVNRLPSEAADSMVRSLMGTLAYLHEEHGVIHRDIKPSNVLFRSVDGLDEPVLCDFGISFDTTGGKAHDAKVLDVCTGFYKAPELCFGVNDYQFEIDVWSMGVLMTLLYSSNGRCVLEDEDDDHERGAVNDIYLISRTFAVFGTPSVTSDINDDRLWWPQMASDRYHFNKFEFERKPRLSLQQLLPRCGDDRVSRVFDQMMVYNRDLRISSAKAWQLLNQPSEDYSDVDEKSP